MYISRMGRFANLVAAAAAVLALAAPLRAPAAELLMFERDGCPYCARWDHEVAPLYEKTPEGKRAPLRRVDLDKGR
ncbi:MAG TPA: thioredoxin family protein, partial [Beijerinckiaceae bacterium]